MDPRPVFYARNAAEAALVCNWLKESGIQAFIPGGAEQANALGLADADPIVVVPGEELERAETAVREFREMMASASLEEISDADGQFNWPVCPVCDELRKATCDSCKTTSSEFAADIEEGQLTAICLACKERVSITFVDRCPYCQHTFDSADEDSQSQAAEFTNAGRVLLLLGGLAALFAVLVWIFLTLD